MTATSQGFAMADALIALIITSLFSTSLLLMGQTTLRATDSGSLRLHAALLARSLIETENLTQNEGETILEGTTYSWQKTIAPAPPSSTTNRYIPLMKVDVSISWDGYQTPQTLRVTTHKLRRPS